MIPDILLKRVTRGKEKTCGVFIHNDNPIAVGLELPWVNNEHDISCIPTGKYKCVLIQATTKFPYQHYAVNDVPGRTNVRIHRGNTAHDTEGCILVARQFSPDGVILSQLGLNDLIAIAPKEFNLTIED